jgi:sulfur-oxidizing protein SoxY
MRRSPRSAFRPAGISRAGLLTVILAATLAAGAPLPASAGKAWDDVQAHVFAGRTIEPAGDIIVLTAPARPLDQRAVPVAVEAAFKDGRTIRAVTLIVDENPTPVAAVFDIGGARDRLKLATKMRLNAATDVRAIVEASDGKLYMADRFVKFAGGQASCSAPPQGDPKEIAANMGRMTLTALGKPVAATEIAPSARLEISHPNHTGMVLDQLTLLYVPLRIVTDLEVVQGEERVFAMKGSMTLSQNPVIDFDYRVNGAEKMRVLVRDSDGAEWQASFPIGQGS